jgi:hypothetical protein
MVRLSGAATDLRECKVNAEGCVLVGEVLFQLVDDLRDCQYPALTRDGLLTSCSCLGLYPSPPIVPMPPAFVTAAAKGPPDVLAMPASMMGYLIPSSLHSGVDRAGVDDMVSVLAQCT